MKTKQLFKSKRIVTLLLVGALLFSSTSLAVHSLETVAMDSSVIVPTYLNCTQEQRESFVRRLPEYEQTENLIGFETEDGQHTVFIFPVPIRYCNSSGAMEMYSEYELNRSLQMASRTSTTTNTNLGFTQEGTVYSATPTTNYSNHTYTTIGNAGALGVGRAYYQPDLSYISNIQAASITSAYMYFYDLGDVGTGSEAIAIHKVTQPWSASTITFNNQPSFTTVPTARFYKQIHLVHRQMVSVTGLVKDWIENGSNYGFVVKASNEAGTESHLYTRTSYPAASELPYMSVTYIPQTTEFWGFVNVNSNEYARGQIIEADNPAISFIVSEEALFYMETAQPNAPFGIAQDTKMYLYDSSGALLASNDNIAYNCDYSRISQTLQPGSYTIRITQFVNNQEVVTDIHTFFTLWIDGVPGFEGASVGFSESFANICKDFRFTGTYNGENISCLEYALGLSEPDDGTLLNDNWNTTYFSDYLASYGYVQTTEPQSNCIVMYGYGTVVQHFAKIQNNVITAKLARGNAPVVSHSSVDAYYNNAALEIPALGITSESGFYGEPIGYFVKVS